MTTFLAAGDSIEGERIVFCFGDVPKPKQAKNRVKGSLRLHGQAWQMKPLKRARLPVLKEMDSILCKEARYLADSMEEKGKQSYGGHRGFVGVLEGNAECRITVPMENIPEARQ